MELAKVWLTTAKEYLGLAKKPHKELSFRQLFVPCKLTTLSDHDMCFQQWTVLQLWVGIIAMLVNLVVEVIFMLDTKLIGFGNILVNASIRLFITVFFAHLIWFGVVKRHGCCCFLACCCEGKPNILLIAILAGIFGVFGVIQVIQLFASGYVLFIIAAISAFVQAVTHLYLCFEALMIWRLTKETTAGDPSKVGAAVAVVGKAATDAAAHVTKEAEV